MVGESKKYDTKESLEELKMKIGNLKVELRDEMVKEDNIKDVGTFYHSEGKRVKILLLFIGNHCFSLMKC